jgi:hypothetical protein
VIERVLRRVSLDWKGAYHHSVGQHLMKSAPAPVEQHEQQGQRASRADRDVEESGLGQRLQEPWTFAGYRAQFDIEALLSQVAERGPLSSGPPYADGCSWCKELADIRGVLIVG